MASFWSFLTMFIIFMAYFASLAFTSHVVHVQFSTISAAPAFLPEAPLSSPPTSSLSPDIEPVFPTTGVAVPSPAESSLPTIPSSPSPPNPDVIHPAPGPSMAFSPSGSLPASSATSVNQAAVYFLGLLLVVFSLMQLSAF
ncbi:hypothetical protein JCGZ_13851 [Jatropha curcas]|uniref:Classical arabinogalactan protein 26 n=2 Tax=Jatropha curcas TaxID=180498 RepID=A0A067K742_JATCU|nr:hypothetical protein JCGZ_13851 [Jatropha curcas]